MTNIGLHTGLRALLSSQLVLDTIGHNIANANTRGYSRQSVQLGASLPLSVRGLLVGSGVDTLGVQRSVDALLARRIHGQVGVGANLGARLSGMREAETLFAGSDRAGVTQSLEDFFSGLSQLSTAPEDSILRAGAVQAAVSLSSRFQELADGLVVLRADARTEVATRVEQANRIAAEIADLNVQISAGESGGAAANDLRDQRDRALEDLAALVDVQTVADPNGSVRVLVAGNTLVSPSRSYAMQVVDDPGGNPAIAIAGASGFVPVTGGSIGGLLSLSGEFVPALRSDLDRLAHELVLEINRVHSTGVPAGGAFHALTASNRVIDRDGDGQRTDELLANAGLPFDVSTGRLWVNVTDESSGQVEKHRIDIRSTHTTVGDLLDELNAIPHLSAGLDAGGRVRLIADAGHGFDFSRRLDPDPDPLGTLGGRRASLATAASGPYALADGDLLQLTADAGGTPVPVTIEFATGDFQEISRATAAEVAAVINADPDAQANGIVATTVNGTLVVQTLAEGEDVSFVLDGGAAATAFGWSGLVGATISGHDDGVEVEISGSYAGASDEVFTFRPNMDGTIGTTDGLTVDVLDSAGRLVATLDVGPGYQPGSTIPIAEGVSVSFTLGELSATHNDLFALDLVTDSDTTDALVALGLNSFFVGSDASDIGVRADLESDPSLLASSLSGSSGDSSLLLELLDVKERGLDGLDGATLGGFFGALTSNVGFQVAKTESALDSNDALLDSLIQRRDQVSGVNVDEELVDLLQYEQSFAAAAQYISVINQLGEELLNLI
jgi:flagellar hook-associated protein 1 FlgK